MDSTFGKNAKTYSTVGQNEREFADLIDGVADHERTPTGEGKRGR